MSQVCSPPIENFRRLILSTEFIPYVFQLLSLLLESNPKAPLPQRYKDLVGPLLTPTLWESRGNVPALVRLLQAIMARGASIFTTDNQLTPVLGIFQKLVSSKVNEVHAFDLLESCFTYFPMYTLNAPLCINPNFNLVHPYNHI